MSYQSPSQIRQQLKKTYRQIAASFSQTRSHPWPEFEFFGSLVSEESKVLDLGCGNGRLYDFLQNKNPDYTGIDFCPELLEIAHKRYPKQTFLEQDITELDLPNSFDVILCIAAFHHIPSTKLRKKTLKLVLQHLEPDGVFLLSVWNLWQWKYAGCFIRSFFRWILSGFRGSPRDLMIPFGPEKIKRYYYAFLPFEVRSLLSQQSFEINEFRVSGHNFLFVCRPRLLKGVSSPIPVSEKIFSRPLRNASPIATCKGPS
ncbi:MAG: class I SAM-dependent methyltransferase [bacterium]|nr:class I SAM-dependent methyltransferase [bacterium]